LPSKFRTTVILEGYTPLPWPTSRRSLPPFVQGGRARLPETGRVEAAFASRDRVSATRAGSCASSQGMPTTGRIARTRQSGGRRRLTSVIPRRAMTMKLMRRRVSKSVFMGAHEIDGKTFGRSRSMMSSWIFSRKSLEQLSANAGRVAAHSCPACRTGSAVGRS